MESLQLPVYLNPDYQFLDLQRTDLRNMKLRRTVVV